jgi:2-polyprenyl-3-methyl-5-hydroxy-6-metoxy-1,4-benzoquinol methylase
VATQYDAIAQEYQRTKESPLRRHVEAYSFFSMLGDVSGLSVLDLACGDGFYTRLLKQAGAASVTGVDISAEMIALAKQSEDAEPLEINYLCNDVATLPDLGKFDVVTAAYLLHYAPDREQLGEMCRRVVSQLKPGGRLVCINENPEQSVADYAGYTQYGFNKSVQEPRKEASPITYAMVSGRNIIRFDAYYYARETYEECLRAAGFVDIDWRPLQLAPEAGTECGTEYWQEYMANPPVIGLECRL